MPSLHIIRNFWSQIYIQVCYQFYHDYPTWGKLFRTDRYHVAISFWSRDCKIWWSVEILEGNLNVPIIFYLMWITDNFFLVQHGMLSSSDSIMHTIISSMILTKLASIWCIVVSNSIGPVNIYWANIENVVITSSSFSSFRILYLTNLILNKIHFLVSTNLRKPFCFIFNSESVILLYTLDNFYLPHYNKPQLG